jgi:hypothetical protein
MKFWLVYLGIWISGTVTIYVFLALMGVIK